MKMDVADFNRDVAGGTPPRSRRKLAIALVAAALVVAAILFWPRHRAAPAAEQGAPHVTVTVPGRHLIPASASATGTIAAKYDMPVGITGEGGMVSRVLVEPGTWVAKGQALAIVERSVQEQQAVSLAASVKVAQADAALAQSNLDRARALTGRGFISRADVEAKQAARDQAVARVTVAKAQLAEQQARNARLVLRAPDAGLVLARSVEAGQIVGGQGTLFRIAQHGDMEMLARVAEQDLARMKVGDAAEVTPIGSTTALRGTIWQIAPVIDPATRQGIARVALHYAPQLRPGGFASARIDAGEANVPLLPESAVLSDDHGNYVLIAGADGKVARRDVKVGDVGEDGVSIASGLEGHEKVVTSAGAFLNPGETIIPVLERGSR